MFLRKPILMIMVLFIVVPFKLDAQLRVAVFPFSNTLKNPKMDWLSHGFCESLNTDLSDDNSISVVDRSDVMAAIKSKGFQLNEMTDVTKALQVAAQLEVDRIIIGSFESKQPDLKVSARFIDVATGKADDKNAYAAEGKFGMNNIFALYGQIANKALVSFGKKTAKDEETGSSKATVNIDAYEPYIKGVVQYSESSTEQDYLQAVEFFTTAIKQDSNYALAYAGAAKCYAKIGRIQDINFKAEEKTTSYKKALNFGLKAVKLDKNLSSAWVSLALIYRELRERDKLMESARKAVAIRPTQYDAYDILGDAFSGNFFKAFKNLDSSIFYRKRSVELEPKFSGGFRGLGTDYFQKGDFANAEEAFKKALQLNPKHAGSHDFLGQIYYAKGNYEKAKSEFQQAFGLDPKSAFAHSHLGDLLSLEGNTDEAVKEYNAAIAANPNAAFAYNGLAWTYLSAIVVTKRNIAKALELSESAVKFSNNNNAEFLFILSMAQYVSGAPEKAAVSIDQAIKLDAANEEYQEVSARFKNKEKSLDHFYLVRKANIFAKHKQAEQAIAILDEANKLVPKNVYTLVNMARAYELKGNKKVAFDVYYQAKLVDWSKRYKSTIDTKLRELEPYK